MKEKNFISAILYVHDTEKILFSTLEKIENMLNKNFEKYEIICVNDASTDQSENIIRRFATKNDNSIISLINMSYYQGREMAMNAGMDLAIGDFVYEFDTAVIDYPSELIEKIYFKSLEGYDIVSAVPKKPNQVSSKLFYLLYNKFSNSHHHLRSERFRILSRRAINRVKNMSKTIPYRKAVYANSGLSMSHIEYDLIQKDSKQLTEKENLFRKRTATDSLILFTDIAYKITLLVAGIMMLAIIGVAIYAIYTYCTSQFVAAGWTTIMLFLSGVFFVTFAILAVIIKYLSILLHLVFNNQDYLVESINKITNQ